MAIEHKNLPDWINWIAQDADGRCWGFEHEPNRSDNGWYENEVGRCQRIDSTVIHADWTQSLRRVVRPRP